MPKLPDGIIKDEHGVTHCWWCGDDERYRRYHDEEWGFPVTDDTRLFEKLCLEGFQAGLSWLTILRKRDNFRTAFRGFDIPKVARFTQRDVSRLLKDAGIVRHRGKIESTINNAKRAIEIQNEFGSLAAYVWRNDHSAAAASGRPKRLTKATIPAMTDASKAMSKDLKQRGFSFIGPTTVYAFMQAMGLVNDHLPGCHVREKVESARRKRSTSTAS